jgi:hypothetical protein
MTARIHSAEVPRRPGHPGAGYHLDGALALRLQGSPRANSPAGGPSIHDESAVHRSAVLIARALLEVLGGWRSPSQLARWTSYQLQLDLERRAPRRPLGSRLQLVRVRVMESERERAEVCALLHDPVRKRIRVLALRLELREGSWIVTRLQTG